MRYHAYKDNGYIRLPVVVFGVLRTFYEIDPTEQSLEDWILHLREKTWFTPELEAELTKLFLK